MNIQTRRENLIAWLESLKDLNLIAQLEEIARSHQEQEPQTHLPKHVKEAIERGQKDFLEGRVLPHQEAMERVRKKVGY